MARTRNQNHGQPLKVPEFPQQAGDCNGRPRLLERLPEAFPRITPGIALSGHDHRGQNPLPHDQQGDRPSAETALRYPYELRDEEDYFDDIRNPKISKDMVELASHILDTKAAHFDPSKFEDEYENALKTLVRRKAAGKPVKSAEREEKPDNVINLMDALKQSLKGRASAKRSAHAPARRASHRPARKAHRSAARARKAG
jgi:hypothetical protein